MQTLKQYIVRISPVTNSPVLFDALSKKDGQLTCVVNGETKTVGLDYYMASTPMEDDEAKQVAQAFAKHANIPLEQIVVRHRLPKTNVKPRRTNDANLVLVKDNKQDDLQQAAQGLQDAHDKEKKASSANPEGATVKRKPEEKRTKRSYNRKPKDERSAKSRAAFERYQRELQATAAQSETFMQPVTPQVPKEVYEKAVQELATKLAKLLLDNNGAL